jgi:hypothetical protein
METYEQLKAMNVNAMTYEQRVALFNFNVEAGIIVLGTVTIAHGGKAHPAMMVMDDPHHPKGRLQIRCSCAGTNNGSAYTRAVWHPGTEKTCGRKR